MKSETQPCSLCERPAWVRINESWFCTEHLDDGFRLIARALGVENGMDPDHAEAMLVELRDKGSDDG